MILPSILRDDPVVTGLAIAPYPVLDDRFRANSSNNLLTPQRGHRLIIRVFPHIGDRPANQLRIVAESAHGCVAEKADDPSNYAGRVIVIDLGGGPFEANSAQAALLLN
jgi:hypothetical protein